MHFPSLLGQVSAVCHTKGPLHSPVVNELHMNPPLPLVRRRAKTLHLRRDKNVRSIRPEKEQNRRFLSASPRAPISPANISCAASKKLSRPAAAAEMNAFFRFICDISTYFLRLTMRYYPVYLALPLPPRFLFAARGRGRRQIQPCLSPKCVIIDSCLNEQRSRFEDFVLLVIFFTLRHSNPNVQSEY